MLCVKLGLAVAAQHVHQLVAHQLLDVGTGGLQVLTGIKMIGMLVEVLTRERILQLCEENGLTINKLCTTSGVTQSTVNNLMSGRNHSVTVATIHKLCDGLGITVEDFFCSELFRNLEPEIK